MSEGEISCEISEFFKNIYFEELRTTATASVFYSPRSVILSFADKMHKSSQQVVAFLLILLIKKISP